VHVSNADGCFDDDSIKITVNDLPVVSKSKDTSICKDAEVQLLAGGGVSYAWTPAGTLNNSKIANPVAKPSSSTNYTVKVTSAEGCSSSDSIRVTVKPVAAITKSNDTTVCDQAPVRLFVSGGVSYSWSPSSTLDNPSSATPVASPLSTTVYHVLITDVQSCTYDDSIKVTIASLPDVQVSKLNNIDCALPLTQLLATGAQDYSWTPVTGLNNPAISNPIASPTVSTTYTVVGKDENGCADSASITVNVNFDGSNLYGLPNAFTPNGDGLNDCFGIKYWGRVTELSLSIYNRFGERVFYTNDASICWDGTYKGEPQNTDVYTYLVKAKTDCGNIDTKGIITLLR
jgi:gliding motility-associated-like protein